MEKLTPEQKEILVDQLDNRSVPLPIRKAMSQELMDEILNPLPAKDFDPNTWDPASGENFHELRKRPREEPPRRLPTMGLVPKRLFVGQRIGDFESKQDLYLLIAWLSNRVSDLEDLIANQQKP